MKVLLRDAAQRETGLIHEKDELQQRVITSCDCHFTSAIKILMFCCSCFVLWGNSYQILLLYLISLGSQSENPN